MWIFVAVQEKEDYYRNGPGGRVKARLEQASGERCLIVPYQEFGLKAVEELTPRAIVFGGFGGRFQRRKVSWFLGMDEVFHGADVPMLCLCGSHQVLAFSFLRDLSKAKLLRDQPMRRLRPGEDLPRRARQSPTVDLSAWYLADGFFPIRRLKDDPLFRGLPRLMTMRCSHYCEVKDLPKGFVRLAESGHCRIEAMRHAERPLYGVQFHPEAYEDPHWHGRTLLGNFAGITAQFWKQG
jgi:GMP synthase-like glutamine amidotransferase